MSTERPSSKGTSPAHGMIELNGLEGSLPAGKVGIVASRYNESICDAMVAAAVETLTNAGLESSQIPILRVPGAWELPLGAKTLAHSDSIVGIVTLGAVIQGETTHDEHINRAVSMAVMDMGLQMDLPIGFGLLTCRTVEQALNRSGGSVGNKGHEAADAVLEMLRLKHNVKSAMST